MIELDGDDTRPDHKRLRVPRGGWLLTIALVAGVSWIAMRFVSDRNGNCDAPVASIVVPRAIVAAGLSAPQIPMAALRVHEPVAADGTLSPAVKLSEQPRPR